MTERTESQQPAPEAGLTEAGTGVFVDRSKLVVLASRLGRGMILLPKVDPSNKDERPTYAAADAFERGEVISIDDIVKLPNTDNLKRLLTIRAVGYLDDTEAQAAQDELATRRAAELAEVADRTRGIALA
jgi:hypothetical protein